MRYIVVHVWLEMMKWGLKGNIPMRGCRITGSVTNFCRERKSVCCQRACMFCCRSIKNDIYLRISETQTNTTCIDVYDEGTLNRDQTCIHLPCM